MPEAPDPTTDFVSGVHREIEQFATARNLKKPIVEVELRDRSRFRLDYISAGPGHGWVVLGIHAEEDQPEEMLVPVQSLGRIELYSADEEEPAFGFSARRRS